MPRRRLTRAARSPLLPGVRVWFETGVVPGQATAGAFEAFVLSNPSAAGRAEARAAWATHRDDVLASWRASGRSGTPWAERFLTLDAGDDDGPKAA